MNNWADSSTKWDEETSLNLLIFFSENQLDICTYNNDTNSFLSNHNFRLTTNNNIAEFCTKSWNTLPFRMADFSSIKIGFSTTKTSLFPLELDNLNCKKILAFEHQLSEEELNQLRIKSTFFGKIAYCIDSEISNWAYQQFKTPDFYSSLEIAINATILAKNNNQVQLTVNDKTFSLIIKKEQEIIFTNNFKYNATEDLLYYTLYTLDQLKIDKETCCFSLFGNLEHSTIDLEMITSFVPIENIETNDTHKKSVSDFINQLILCE